VLAAVGAVFVRDFLVPIEHGADDGPEVVELRFREESRGAALPGHFRRGRIRISADEDEGSIGTLDLRDGECGQAFETRNVRVREDDVRRARERLPKLGLALRALE